jgi:hypothetical protein
MLEELEAPTSELVASCERGNESSVYVKHGEFLE